MKLIELTYNSVSIYINPDQMVYFGKGTGSTTVIYFALQKSDGIAHSITVNEPVEVVLEKFQEA